MFSHRLFFAYFALGLTCLCTGLRIPQSIKPCIMKANSFDPMQFSSPPVDSITTSTAGRNVPLITSALLVSNLALPLASVAAESDSSLEVVFIVKPLLDLFINVMNLLFLSRTIISWYPKTDTSKFPFNAIVWPTEPLLVPVRGLVPPAFGVDISAIVWIFILSFVREILIGPQGIMTLIENRADIA